MFKWLKNRSEMKNLSTIATAVDNVILLNAAGILRSQLDALDNKILKIHGYVHGNFARGYMYGFLEAAIRDGGSEIRDDMQLILLMMLGHTYFFDKDADKGKRFGATSQWLLDEMKDAEFISAKALGASEYCAAIDNKVHPSSLLQGYLAQR